jgi:hypothetical protein
LRRSVYFLPGKIFFFSLTGAQFVASSYLSYIDYLTLKVGGKNK